jgi:hypothetical protein
VSVTELRTATEVANLVVKALRRARQHYLAPEITDVWILSGEDEPQFTLTFTDTREEYTVSVQRSSDG